MVMDEMDMMDRMDMMDVMDGCHTFDRPWEVKGVPNTSSTPFPACGPVKVWHPHSAFRIANSR